MARSASTSRLSAVSSSRMPKGATPTLALTRRSRPAIVIVAPDRIASPELGRDPLRLVLGARRQHDRELVAAEAGERVGGAQPRAERIGDARKDHVAGDVAEAVVDLLEPVEVEHHDRARRAAAPSDRDLAGELVGEPAAVEEAGERVLVGEVPEPLLVPGPARDVLRGAQQPIAALAVPGHVGTANDHGPHRPVGPDDPMLDREGRAGLDRVGDDALVLRLVGGVDELADALGRHLEALARESVDPVDAVAPVHGVAVELVFPRSVVRQWL